MTERDYAIKSFKEITLNAKRHTEQRMDLYYEKIKTLMSDYQDLILENQMVLEELEQECQDKINENMAFPMDQIICGNREYQPEQGSMYYRLKAYAKYLQMCVTVACEGKGREQNCMHWKSVRMIA